MENRPKNPDFRNNHENFHTFNPRHQFNHAITFTVCTHPTRLHIEMRPIITKTNVPRHVISNSVAFRHE